MNFLHKIDTCKAKVKPFPRRGLPNSADLWRNFRDPVLGKEGQASGRESRSCITRRTTGGIFPSKKPDQTSINQEKSLHKFALHPEEQTIETEDQLWRHLDSSREDRPTQDRLIKPHKSADQYQEEAQGPNPKSESRANLHNEVRNLSHRSLEEKT